MGGCRGEVDAVQKEKLREEWLTHLCVTFEKGSDACVTRDRAFLWTMRNATPSHKEIHCRRQPHKMILSNTRESQQYHNLHNGATSCLTILGAHRQRISSAGQ